MQPTDTMVVQAIRRYWAQLGVGGVTAARRAATFWKQQSLATMSSGTDVFVYVSVKLRDTIPDFPQFNHKWSCEKAEGPRQFLISQFGASGANVFGENGEMVNGRSWCFSRGAVKMISWTNGLAAGFTCTSRTPANKNSAKMLQHFGLVLAEWSSLQHGLLLQRRPIVCDGHKRAGNLWSSSSFCEPIWGWVINWPQFE